ncbi:MAG: c-type cytochrome domain-containing protein [Verrucomicrobiota bacterium]
MSSVLTRLIVCLLLLLFLLAGISAGLGATPPGVVASADGTGLFRWRPFLAPFHSVVLHFPIGFVTIAFVLEMYSFRRPSAELRRAIGLVLVLCVASAAVAIALGVLRGSAGEYDARMLNRHKAYGFAVGILTVLALLFHWLAYRKGEIKPLAATYRLTTMANLVVLVIAGHQGGNLTHGSQYLVKNAPYFVKSIIEQFDDVPIEEEITLTVANEQDREYVEKVLPILEAKCLKCHGAEKQKGGYRLDQQESALKGGDSGEVAIKPGDPLNSHLVKLILLPADHDEIMPPSGKGTLSSDEIMTLIRWVQNGARFPAPPDKAQLAATTPTEPAAETNAVAVPEPARAAVAQPSAAAAPPPVTAASKPKVDFIKHIKPILEEHCVVCHGPEKQKSHFRLDTKEFAFKGGRNGKAIIPGHAAESPMYIRATLPPELDIADEAMPPEHKKLPMTSVEIGALETWINAGAPWPDGVVLAQRAMRH